MKKPLLRRLKKRHVLEKLYRNTLKLVEAKTKAATLEVKESFLKEKQALRMATEELELRQQIAGV